MTTEQPHTPSPAHRPSERTFHGDTVVDPFEWMRDKTDPEVIAHLEAENAYADARTAHLDALRGTLVEEFVGHTQETDLSVPVRRDDWWYIVRTTAGNDYPMFTRIADAGTLPQVEPGVMLEGEQVLLDAQAEAAGREFYSLGGLAPSPDHTLYASAVDTAGDERFTLRITDLTSGQVVDEAVTGAGYGLAFSSDQQWLFYARVDDAWRQHQIWRHRIGSDASEDVLVIEEPDERFMIGFDRSRDGSTLVIQAGSTSTTEAWLLDLADPSSAPVPAGGRRDGVDYTVEHAGDRLLVVHNDGHRGFALAQAPLEDPSRWEELLVAAEGERLLSVEAFAGFIALELRSGGLASVRLIPRAADGSLQLERVRRHLPWRRAGHGGAGHQPELGPGHSALPAHQHAHPAHRRRARGHHRGDHGAARDPGAALRPVPLRRAARVGDRGRRHRHPAERGRPPGGRRRRHRPGLPVRLRLLRDVDRPLLRAHAPVAAGPRRRHRDRARARRRRDGPRLVRARQAAGERRRTPSATSSPRRST
jgi:hypothetical protein